MTQLRSLSLHFRTIAIAFPLPLFETRLVLPALTHLNYRGSMAYSEGIFTLLDAPSLKDIEITFNNPSRALPEFKKIFDRIEKYRPHCETTETHLLSSKPTVLMSSKMPGAFMRLKLQSLSKPSLMRISSMAQICLSFSPFLLNDERYLRISTTRPSERTDSSFRGELLELFNPFTGENSGHLRLDANHYKKIVRTSQPSRHKNVLPAMDKIYIPQPGPRHRFIREAVVSAMVKHRLSGHPLEVEYEQPCDINEQCQTGAVFDQCRDRYLLTWF